MSTSTLRIGRRSIILCALVIALSAGPVTSGTGQAVRIASNADVLVSTGEDYPHVEPHLAVDPRQPARLVVAAMTLPQAGEPFVIRVYRSEDGGATWSSRPLRAARLSGTGDDPWLAFDPAGTLNLVQLPDLLWRSRDGGMTWEEPLRLPDGGYDAPKLAIDRSGGGHHGTLYVTGTKSLQDENEGGVRAAAILRSGPGEQDFDDPHHILPNDFANKAGNAVVLPDGTLVMVWHELFHEGEPVESPRLWSVRSVDGGRSFSRPSLVTSGFLSISPFVAVDRSDGPRRGRVYVVWLGLRGDRNHYVAHSDDAGATWSDPLALTARGDDSLFPTPVVAAVADDGTLGVLWSENLAQMGSDCFDMRFSASVDGAATFSEPVVVSDEPSCSNTPENRVRMTSTPLAERFEAGGDYYGLAALPDGSFQAVWADSRTGVFQLWTDRLEVERR